MVTPVDSPKLASTLVVKKFIPTIKTMIRNINIIRLLSEIHSFNSIGEALRASTKQMPLDALGNQNSVPVNVIKRIKGTNLTKYDLDGQKIPIEDKYLEILRATELDLSTPENEEFTINRIETSISSFKGEALKNELRGHLQPVPITAYNERNIPADLDPFRCAENAYVKAILDIDEESELFYMPIPLIQSRKVEAVNYLVYDKNNLSNEASASLDQLPEKVLEILIIQINEEDIF